MISDLELERNVLGGMINSKDYVYEIEKYLVDGLFTTDLHRKIADKIKEYISRGDDYNLITLSRSISDVSPVEIVAISSKCVLPDVRNAQLLYDQKVNRDIFVLGHEIVRLSEDITSDPYDILQKIQSTIADLYVLGESEAKTMAQACSELYEVVKKNQQSDKELTGSPYNLTKLNDATGGLHGGELTILAAESQMGKTALALNIMQTAATYGDTVGIFSMEMNSSLLASRLVSRASGVSGFRLLRKKLVADEFKMLDEGIGATMDLPIYIDENSNNTATGIANTIRSWKTKYGIKGFVVDYLQMMKLENSKNEQGLADAVRVLKNVCVEQNVWCILLSQLNRNMEYPVPTLQRLRGSGQIEEGADNVILIYRPEKYPSLNLSFPNEFSTIPIENKAWIHLAKARNGSQVDFICNFDGSTTTFSDLDDTIIINNKDIASKVSSYNDVPF